MGILEAQDQTKSVRVFKKTPPGLSTSSSSEQTPPYSPLISSQGEGRGLDGAQKCQQILGKRQGRQKPKKLEAAAQPPFFPQTLSMPQHLPFTPKPLQYLPSLFLGLVKMGLLFTHPCVAGMILAYKLRYARNNIVFLNIL